MNPVTAEYFSGSLRLTSQTVKQVVKIRRKRVTNKLNIIELCGYLDSTWKYSLIILQKVTMISVLRVQAAI